MLARRVIAVSPDKPFGKRLGIALQAAGGTVEVHQTLDALGRAELQAALVVVHLDGPLAGAAPALLAQLPSETQLLAVLPRSNLAAVVELMQASDRVAGMLVAEDFDTRQLTAMATRVIVGDIFGLEKTLPWGTLIHTFAVGDDQDRARCITQISQLASTIGVRRKYREAIEQCLDEMLMNALYDAPVDEQGRQLYADLPTRARISRRVEHEVVVQYACDGTQVALAVRDAFGTLERTTVLRYLHKCLHNAQQIDRKVGGAGLGLYLMTNAATSVYFNVLPGIATEAVCTFDLGTPKLRLARFGFFTGAAHPVERRAPRVVAAPRGVIALLTTAIVVTLALIAIAAWPRRVGTSRAHAPIVRIETRPAGASVTLDGVAAGTTPLAVTTLPPGARIAITFAKPGYQMAHTELEVPGPGKELRLVQPLAPAPAGATVRAP